jgi:stearoyl-CoA desaturase (delta-9 desaturase)
VGIPANVIQDGRKSSTNIGRELLEGTPFILMHLVPLLALLPSVEVTIYHWVFAAVLYFVRMFGVTGVYHRYFSHRTYKTSRWFQFFLAVLAQSSGQKGALWWAAKHRHHHKFSDQPEDVHSPIQSGFFYSHIGWMFDNTSRTDLDQIRDFAKYPELQWLNRFWWVPPALLAVVVGILAGPAGLFISFGVSTIAVWHASFAINSLTHLFGKQVYESGDHSRNSLILALITMGEGWHNNHHYYQSCARQGFHWWQIDLTYYVLRGLAAVGLIWAIREPPAQVVAGHWRKSKGQAQTMT